MEDSIVIGVDVGGTKIAAALVDKKGCIVKEVNNATCYEDFSSFLMSISGAINQLLEYSAKMKLVVDGMGIGVAGLVDFKKQKVLFAPNLPLKEVPLKSILEEKFKIPAVVDNDANCAAWGERVFGAGRDAQNFICVTLGTGIGGGIVIGGRLYRGAIGGAGEIGHMVIDMHGPRCACGRLGCLEALASAQALVARAVAEMPPNSRILELVNADRQKISGEVLAEAAKQGDVFTRALFADIGRILGTGFANLINIIDPEFIVIAGGLAAASEFILPAAQEEAASHIMASGLRLPRIVLAQLGQEAGVIGAAVLCREGSG